MKTVEQELKQMNESAEQIKSDEHKDVVLAVGDNIRQGDLYIVRIGRMPKGKKRANRQLAIGTTQGSRHVLEGEVETLIDPDPDAAHDALMECKAIASPDIQEYQIGPAFMLAEPATVTHPEHGDRTLSEPGCYQVIYQRALDADMRERREQD